MLREGRELIPTAKAFQLMTLLRGLEVEELCRADLTGEWEYKLSQMEKGELSREAFMQQIAAMTEKLVKKAKEYDRDTMPGDYATPPRPAPTAAAWSRKTTAATPARAPTGSEGCGFSFTKSPAGRTFETAEAEPCCATAASARWKASAPRPAGPSPPKWPSCATRRHRTTSWNSTSATTRKKTRRDRGFQRPAVLGPCPKCGARLRAWRQLRLLQGRAHAAAATPSCDFKSGQIILQQPIEREQMSKLLQPARPICWRSSSPTARAATSRPSWSGMRKRAR
jgi:DNA topoisomerase-3